MKLLMQISIFIQFTFIFSWEIAGAFFGEDFKLVKFSENSFALVIVENQYNDDYNATMKIIRFDSNGNINTRVIYFPHEFLALNGIQAGKNTTIYMLMYLVFWPKLSTRFVFKQFGVSEINDKILANISQNSYINAYTKVFYNAQDNSLVFSLSRIYYNLAFDTTFQYDNEENLLWEQDYNLSSYTSDSKSLTLNLNTSEIILIDIFHRSCLITVLQWQGFIKFSRYLRETRLYNLKTTFDNGYISIGYKQLNNETNSVFFKFDKDMEEEWIFRGNCATNIADLSNAIQIKDQNYLISALACAGDPFLIGLYSNGTIRYRKRLKYNYEVIGLAEINSHKFVIAFRPGNYGYRNVVYAYTEEIPKDFHKLKCLDLSECGTCAIGYYWNYTQCIVCPQGCLECDDSENCLRCSRNYYLSPKNICIQKAESLCNCSTQNPDISQDCLSKCSSQICISLSTDVFIEHYNPFINKSICKCPENLFDNKTHCIKYADSVECPPLCAKCIYNNNADKFSLLPNFTTSCLKCKLNNTIISDKISENSEFVHCKCRPGFYLNSSECVLSVVTIHSKKNKTTDLFTLFLGIFGAIIAGGSIIWSIIRKFKQNRILQREIIRVSVNSSRNIFPTDSSQNNTPNNNFSLDSNYIKGS